VLALEAQAEQILPSLAKLPQQAAAVRVLSLALLQNLMEEMAVQAAERV
jgi:hypothetical protein